MRKKGIWAAGIALVLLLSVSLAGALTYLSTTVQAEKPAPAVTYDVPAAAENPDNTGEYTEELQSEDYITIEDEEIPAAAEPGAPGPGSDIVGVSEGVAFSILGVVAGVMGIAAAVSIAVVLLSRHRNR